uniref:Calmodulin binding transcription activator 2 n=1 Tax=Varanus komodoensis TaxID=61221 RepID=A0A8D2LHD2_VARKO
MPSQHPKSFARRPGTCQGSEGPHGHPFLKSRLKVFLPKKLLECVSKCPGLPKERLRWNTNEEIASYLITFEKHEEWLSCSPKTRPQNGSIILYNRKKVKYRKDGYCWKKRKDGKTTREDHMKLKVKGVECLYGCYVHSSIVPTFHRRCYWLLQNPDIVLVHYLNVPAVEDCGKPCGPALCSIGSDRKEWLKWSQEELVGQLKPMFHGIKWTCSSGNGTAEFSIEQLVQQVLESHQAKVPRTHACLCSSGLGSPGHVPHKCSSTRHRIISPKLEVRPGPHPALTDVRNVSGGPEVKADPEPARPPGPDSTDRNGAPAASPGGADAVPDSTQPSPGPARPGGFPAPELPAVTLAVGLPASILVMTGLGGAEKPLALTPSQHLVSGDGGGAPATPLGLALLPGPGLVLSQSLGTGMEAGEAGEAAFDPDRFLNSPKRGQTYGGGPGLQPKPEPPEDAAPPPFPLYLPANRFFIQDDPAGQPPAPGAPPATAGPEPRGAPEVPMETAGEGGPLAGPGPPGDGKPARAAAAEISATELQEELYSMIQTVAAAAAGSSFGLSFDSHFPDLISELLPDEAASCGARGMEGAEGPGPALPEPLVEPSFGAKGPPGGSPQPLVSITDFSRRPRGLPGPPSQLPLFLPRLGPQGGVKVLITGPWTDETERYHCLFDQVAVPASLIQPGVLRCYCPAHEAGPAPLHVATQDSRLLSWPVLFEYRARNFLAPPSTPLDWLSLDDNQFRMSILERLEQMEKRMAEMVASAGPPTQAGQGFEGRRPTPCRPQAAPDAFEERIVALCETMMGQSCWLRSETLVRHSSFRGMTLLHLAAAQGYTRLIESLLKWRTLGAQSLDLEQEVDPLNVDHFSCTPLMWACALGHMDAARLLYHWNRHALSIPDSLGRLPLTVARSRGHVKLATCLEELQRQEEAAPDPPGPEPAAERPGSASKACGGPRRPAEALHIPSPLSATPLLRPRWQETQGAAGGQVGGRGAVAAGAAGPSVQWRGAQAGGGPASPGPGPLACPPTGARGLPLSACLCCSRQVDVITLAKQIVEATPEHIKQEDFSSAETPLRERPGNVGLSETMSWLASYLESVDQLPSASQRRSPSGHGCLSPLHSPLGDLALERLPPPPTAAGWAEFLNASANGKMESEFALLTLSDHEQRELYEAAKVIQTAFRKYKGRRLKEQQEVAAAVIQRCYRKYKQYALYKKMTQAAILIQSKFRSYYEQKKFQQSRRAAVLIQQCYRSYKEYERLKQGHRASSAMQQKIKGTFLTKKQDQAARKIMRFLRRCRHRPRLRQSLCPAAGRGSGGARAPRPRAEAPHASPYACAKPGPSLPG